MPKPQLDFELPQIGAPGDAGEKPKMSRQGTIGTSAMKKKQAERAASKKNGGKGAVDALVQRDEILSSLFAVLKSAEDKAALGASTALEDYMARAPAAEGAPAAAG